jgi:hypothetical protein
MWMLGLAGALGAAALEAMKAMYQHLAKMLVHFGC